VTGARAGARYRPRHGTIGRRRRPLPRPPLAVHRRALGWRHRPPRRPALQRVRAGQGLSRDDDTGASSLLIKEPPGWHTAAAEAHGALQEDILLEGDCWYAETHYEAPAYFCFPPGHFHGPMFTETGGLWLVTLDGPFDVRYSGEVRAEQMSWFERARADGDAGVGADR